MPESIEERVIAIVADQFGVEAGDVTRDSRFVADLNADSLDSVELCMELEDEFDVDIDDKQAQKMPTVGATIDWIAERLTARGEA